ncbi:MAG: ABC transporter permease, partial [Planctomycetota bacterium]
MTRHHLDIAREGLRHVLRHPLRSFLTAITCAVAIAVTVNVISLSYGLDADVRRDVSQFGRRTVDLGRFPVLVPGMRRDPLGPAEEARLRNLLQDLDPVIAPRRQVAGTAEGEARVERIAVVAAGTAYLQTLDIPVEAGRWFLDDDAAGDVCVLDESAARELFPDRSPVEVVGRTITVSTPVGERTRRVLGVLRDPLMSLQSV